MPIRNAALPTSPPSDTTMRSPTPSPPQAPPSPETLWAAVHILGINRHSPATERKAIAIARAAGPDAVTATCARIQFDLRLSDSPAVGPEYFAQPPTTSPIPSPQGSKRKGDGRPRTAPPLSDSHAGDDEDDESAVPTPRAPAADTPLLDAFVSGAPKSSAPTAPPTAGARTTFPPGQGRMAGGTMTADGWRPRGGDTSPPAPPMMMHHHQRTEWKVDAHGNTAGGEPWNAATDGAAPLPVRVRPAPGEPNPAFVKAEERTRVHVAGLPAGTTARALRLAMRWFGNVAGAELRDGEAYGMEAGRMVGSVVFLHRLDAIAARRGVEKGDVKVGGGVVRMGRSEWFG
ncbi:hypothetical protein GTA08_BOTSDO10079 [Botryosphaeria dothidea]|uniref:RRM domain-containing protein n=1 Tax=Botryosphaeria dothidea TaxID=55169 RepID=A0A8H4N0D2_9PEZI|nr:hypothetical protein GTA08_BOTSDO10079 [Botryosphaeria dothidea]